MKVLLLAAGYGTRLYPLTKNIPKALLPIEGKPVIEYTIERLNKYNQIDDIYIVTNDRFFPKINEWKDTFISENNSSIEVINDNTNSDENKLGAVGDIGYILDKKNITDSVLVIASDNLFEFGLNDFFKAARDFSKCVTIGTVDFSSNKKAISKYGVVKLDSDNRVIEFEEKPDNPASNLVAIGLYYFPEETLSLISKYLREGNNPDNTGYLIRWLCENYKVYAHKFPCKWYDVGSFEGYKLAGGDLKRRE